MDKSTETIDSIPLTLPLPSARQPTPSMKKKIFQSIEEAFAAFEEDDGIEVELPPIPQKEDVQNQLIQNALLLVDSGEYALSRNILAEVLKKNNHCVEAIRWMGWCFKQEGQFSKAQKLYERLIELRQTDQDFFELGEIYYSLDDDLSAISTWQQALSYCGSESPHLFDLYKNLGNAFTRSGDYESAEENYNKAHTLRSNSDGLQVNFGSLAFQRQNYLQAMAYFKGALEINPFNDRAWCGISLVAREMKDFDWARATVLRAIDINPQNSSAAEILGALDNGT